ncbi:EAL domain-containing protein [Pseudohongiella sp. SYSU M77423]|uniref:EAL domain-containing protein n=1 Tax=Pseudohongiella sp. SYSU M77423 TaxID=3042312 RepID=UPI0024818C5E|nr:EAL domain-containing protein [Pseudohongiella sp. SYSU M77423]MDH7943944.1 EAL domain-containing protein [Pseudohongiella sp. SYSU M77423]
MCDKKSLLRAGFLITLAVLTTLMSVAYAQPVNSVLRVGVYENPPKLFLDEQGRITGIHGDLLREIARAERWQLRPVPCQWSECLTLLERGEIDIMPDVAIDSDRQQRFDFHQQPALLSWSQIYESRGQGIVGLLDLDGKRIALLQDSIQQAYLESLADNFFLNVDWLAYDNQTQAFSAVSEGVADAVVSSSHSGDMEASRFGLTPTPILFQPSQLYYAVPAGRHEAVLTAIDNYLSLWRADPGSVYYRILEQWNYQNDRSLPGWVIWGSIALGLALLVAVAFSLALSYRVKARTRSLQESEQRLNVILNSVDAYIYIKDYKLRYQYVNRKVCELFGRPENEIIGKTDESFFDSRTYEQIRQNDMRVIRQGERVAHEEHSVSRDGKDEYTFLSVKIPLRNPDNTISSLCGISTDITEHRKMNSQLQQLASFDSLTGLPNRRLILERLEHALGGHEITGYQGALVLLDLDNFKSINDSLGHNHGDALLKHVAHRIERSLLPTDTSGRLGADEFVIIVEDLALELDDAVNRVNDLAETLRVQLSDPIDLHGHEVTTSVSVGVAMFSDAESVDELLKAVDLALGAAKNAGRNTVKFFNPTMQIEVTRRTNIEKALRRALDGTGLDLHLQPQVDGDGRMVGMEGLLRWEDAMLGRVPPGDFIPVAESAGLIVPLGEWVIAEACRILKRWQQHSATRSMTLAINISSRQFRSPKFVRQIADCIEQSGVDGRLLELEVTESLLIEDVQSTIERMRELRAMGIRFALDDFGTGYASLSYLKRLPLSQLKIDQSFVRDLMDDINDEAIVKTIIALGASLDLRVIAEGVETAAQAERLTELGCYFKQGYYFGAPQPEEAWQPVFEQAAPELPRLPQSGNTAL